MNNLLPLILNIGFLVIVGVISLVAALCVYIYIRYGRTRSITVFSSLVFIGVYLVAVMAAYATLQTVINFYA